MNGVLWTGIRKAAWVACGLALAMVASEVPALASPPSTAVPEISGASMASAMGLVGAGLLWLRARRVK